MSIESKATVTCPECGENFETNYWKSLNAQFNPVENAQLLSGELFYAVCTKCNTKHSFTYPMLYHDMDNKVMIQLSPSVKDNDEYIEKHFAAKAILDKELPETSSAQDDYQFRIVNSVNELREKAMIFRNNLDDRVVELLKAFCRTKLTEANPDIIISQILFYKDDVSEKIVVLSDDNSQYSVDYDMNLYLQISKSFKQQIIERSDGCYLIDQNWAFSVLLNESV